MQTVRGDVLAVGGRYGIRVRERPVEAGSDQRVLRSLLKNCYPLHGKLGLGDLTPLQCRYDFGRQTLVGTAEGSTVSFKFVTFSFELNK